METIAAIIGLISALVSLIAALASRNHERDEQEPEWIRNLTNYAPFLIAGTGTLAIVAFLWFFVLIFSNGKDTNTNGPVAPSKNDDSPKTGLEVSLPKTGLEVSPKVPSASVTPAPVLEPSYIPRREGLVTEVAPNSVTIDIGRRDKLQIGDTLDVLLSNAPITDELGDKIGLDVALLEVVRLEDKTAEAKIKEKAPFGDFRRGDRVIVRKKID